MQLFCNLIEIVHQNLVLNVLITVARSSLEDKLQ